MHKDQLAVALTNVAMMHKDLGHLEQAIVLQNEAMRLSQELGEPSHEAYHCGSLGQLYQAQGRYGLAKKQFLRSLELHRRVQNERFESVVLGFLGELALDQEHHEEAAEYFEQCLSMALAAGDHIKSSNFYTRLGQIHLANREYEKAASRLDQGEQRARRVGAVRALLVCLAVRGLLEVACERLETARNVLQEIETAGSEPLLNDPKLSPLVQRLRDGLGREESLEP